MVQHNFGYETLGDAGYSIENVIHGSVFTITEAGTADSITVGCTYGTGTWTGKIKCAIYLHSDLSRVGVTDERTVTLTSIPAWYTFDFSGTKPSLLATTAYILVAWAEDVTNGAYIRYNTGDTNQGHYQSATYGTFPNPLAPTHLNKVHSIYCTYTVAGAGVTVKKGSNLAATMTEMLNSKMLFSACNRFPKLTTRRF